MALTDILKTLDFDKSFHITLPDGSEYRHGTDEPVFKMRIKTDRALRESMSRGTLGFGEAYMAEEIDVEGDLQEVSHLGFVLKDGGMINPTLMEKLKFAWAYFSRRNTLEGSRENIRKHYDLGNDFYSLWLDREAMQYTCAYFEEPNQTIERAQLNKLHLICRKLRLQPGETVVEAGCGWGGFARFAAKEYGVKMRSYNISREQIAYATEKARSEGLGPDQVEYVLDDYRNIGKDGATYDKFVSIGMLEHVGLENYTTLYDIIHRVVKPEGLALVHSISRIHPTKTDPWLEKYIFPGSYIPSLAEMVDPVEKRNRPLHIVDVENLRYHYALTLDRWTDRFEQHADHIRKTYDEAFVRMFRLYLRASAAGFRYGGILLYQLLLSNGYDDGAPLTRHHIISDAVKARAAGAKKTAVKASANGRAASNGRSASNGNGRRATGKSPAKTAKKKK